MRSSDSAGSEECKSDSSVRQRAGGAKVEKYPASWVEAATVYSVASLWLMTAFRDAGQAFRPAAVLHGEFDPGSGRTLAACLTHASGATNQGLPWGRAANG